MAPGGVSGTFAMEGYFWKIFLSPLREERISVSLPRADFFAQLGF